MSTEPTAGWFEGLEHHLPVRIYYEDTDFTGVVYHANYLRYFERGRSDYLRAAGINHTDLLNRPDPAAFTVTNIEIAYRRAARVDDALIVRTRYLSIRGARLTIVQQIMRRDELIAEATVQAACITPDGRARRPPADLVTRLTPLLSGDAP